MTQSQARENTPSSGATFTKAQLLKYFKHINLPSEFSSVLETHLTTINSGLKLNPSLLTALHVHQIAAIPYENLSLHYSKDRNIALHPHKLYEKFIERNHNRGGYCMEVALFFLHILRSLGFDAYPTGVRIRLRKDGVPSGEYVGFVHIVIIVEFPNLLDTDGIPDKYVCDVGFGGDGPTVPMPLRTGYVIQNLGTQEIRFAYDYIPQVGRIGRHEGSRRQRFWIYQYRNSSAAEWNSFYCFAETEFLEVDFNVINHYTSTGQTFQLTTILIVKFIPAEHEADMLPRIRGKLMLVNETVKRNMGGKTEIVQVCQTEAERVIALQKWFGITLTQDEIEGITSSVAVITGS
jgi:arylamine N-acetyltransferase